MHKHFCHKNKTFFIGIEVKYIATQLFYQHTPIDMAIYKSFQCFSHKYTDSSAIANGGCGVINTLTLAPLQMAGVGYLFTYVKMVYDFN